MKVIFEYMRPVPYVTALEVDLPSVPNVGDFIAIDQCRGNVRNVAWEKVEGKEEIRVYVRFY